MSTLRNVNSLIFVKELIFCVNEHPADKSFKKLVNTVHTAALFAACNIHIALLRKDVNALVAQSPGGISCNKNNVLRFGVGNYGKLHPTCKLYVFLKLRCGVLHILI